MTVSPRVYLWTKRPVPITVHRKQAPPLSSRSLTTTTTSTKQCTLIGSLPLVVTGTGLLQRGSFGRRDPLQSAFRVGSVNKRMWFTALSPYTHTLGPGLLLLSVSTLCAEVAVFRFAVIAVTSTDETRHKEESDLCRFHVEILRVICSFPGHSCRMT